MSANAKTQPKQPAADDLAPSPIAAPAAATVAPPQQAIVETLKLLFRPGQVFEIRGLKCRHYGRPATYSGYFRADRAGIVKAAGLAWQLSDRMGAEGVYVTLNPLKPDTIHRRDGKLEPSFKDDGSTATDGDVDRRRNMIFDFDARREVSGISASDAEVALAREAAEKAREHLRGMGFPEGVLAHSGNGYHLLYRIDEPADDGGLVKRCLEAVAAGFDAPGVDVDRKVFNPSRICKLYGTFARKGSDSPGRPHRMSAVVDRPEGDLAPVPHEKLLELAATAPADPKRTAARQTPAKRTRTDNGGPSPAERGALYLATLPPAVSGQNGHDRLYSAAMTLVEGFGLSADEARPVLLEYNARCEPPFSEAEVDHKLASAEKNAGPDRGRLLRESRPGRLDVEGVEFLPLDGTGEEKKASSTPEHTSDAEADPTWLVRNYRTVIVEGPDGKQKPTTEPLPIADIRADLMRLTEGWPHQIEGELFYPHPGGEGVAWIKNKDAFVAWLGERTKFPPVFKSGAGFHDARQLFESLQVNSEPHAAFEIRPHVPPIAGHYYACDTTPPGDGTHLDRFVGFFSPETQIDHDLMKAAVVTCFWGGPPGRRPAFLFTADEGRGAGKSTFVQKLAPLAGGMMMVNQGVKNDVERILNRLLSPGALTDRIMLIDNIKSSNFSWGELEAILTASVVSGHKLHHGERKRPNYLTWFLTMNGAVMSTDMAQRTVVVKIRKAEYAGNWDTDVDAFVRDHRPEIVGDALAFFRQDTQPLAETNRWATWNQEVLARLPEPNEAIRVIAERQIEIDHDRSESAEIEDYFARKLQWAQRDPRASKVFISSQTACRWLQWVLNDRGLSQTKSTRMINQRISEGLIRRLQKASHSHGRGFIWVGEGCQSQHGCVDTDLDAYLGNITDRPF